MTAAPEREESQEAPAVCLEEAEQDQEASLSLTYRFKNHNQTCTKSHQLQSPRIKMLLLDLSLREHEAEDDLRAEEDSWGQDPEVSQDLT